MFNVNVCFDNTLI